MADSETARTALAVVDAATVELPRHDGRGVLVPGGFILTAAHRIHWSGEGDMALAADDYRERVVTADGRALEASVLAVEPVADVAVLGPVDAQRDPDAADAFDAFVEGTRPVPLFTGEPVSFDEAVQLLVLNRDRRWVPATGWVFAAGQPTLPFEAAAEIEGGASGGPIVTPAGELVAVVSTCAVTDGGGPADGNGARPLWALPAWLAVKLREANAAGARA